MCEILIVKLKTVKTTSYKLAAVGGKTAFMYQPLSRGIGRYSTILKTANSEVVFNRLALNYTIKNGLRNPMQLNYKIYQVNVKGWSLNGVAGSQGSTLGGGMQSFNLGSKWNGTVIGRTY